MLEFVKDRVAIRFKISILWQWLGLRVPGSKLRAPSSRPRAVAPAWSSGLHSTHGHVKQVCRHPVDVIAAARLLPRSTLTLHTTLESPVMAPVHVQPETKSPVRVRPEPTANETKPDPARSQSFTTVSAHTFQDNEYFPKYNFILGIILQFLDLFFYC